MIVRQAPVNVRNVSRVLIRDPGKNIFTFWYNNKLNLGITPDLPGGGLEHGETPLQCARREIEEEVGLYVPLVDFKFLISRRYSYTKTTGEVVSLKAHVFLLDINHSQKANIVLENNLEVVKTSWKPLDNLINEVSYLKTIDFYLNE